MQLFLLATLPVSFACAGELIKGRVEDIGLPAQANGIGGVAVVISEMTTQNQVGDGVTDATGTYEIEINTPHPAKLVAAFSKIGYVARPTYQSVSNTAPRQPSVMLSMESAPEAYYKAVADNISAVFTSNPIAAIAAFPAVTALPVPLKETVFNALRLRDSGAYESIRAADQTYQATQEFLTKYKSGGGEAGEKAFSAYANYGNTGTVWLFGAVPNAGSKRDFEKTIKSFAAVREVKNDLVIFK